MCTACLSACRTAYAGRAAQVDNLIGPTSVKFALPSPILTDFNLFIRLIIPQSASPEFLYLNVSVRTVLSLIFEYSSVAERERASDKVTVLHFKSSASAH